MIRIALFADLLAVLAAPVPAPDFQKGDEAPGRGALAAAVEKLRPLTTILKRCLLAT